MKRLVWLVLAGLLIVPGLVLAQDMDPVKFDVDADNAIVWHGDQADDWDTPYTDPGAVFYHDGQFHMFRNGFRGWPAPVDIGYLTSDDGLTWTEVTEDPVIYADDSPFDVTAVLATSGLVEDDGTWVLYLRLHPRTGDDDPLTGVVRATASDPLGPWTYDEEPVLAAGEDGAWDAGILDAPSVVKTDEGYMMWYGSRPNQQAAWAIGLATSDDGISWEKHGDPVFTVSDDPAAWDANHVHQPSVVQSPDGYVMAYRSFEGGQTNRSYGLAISEDGVNWERVGDEPAFSERDIRRRGPWFHELVYHEGTYYFYIEIFRGYQNETDIYVGTYSDALR